MELKEFIEKVDQILRFNFGYTYSFEPANPSYNYSSNGDSYNWTFDFDPDNNKGVCPSALSIVVYTRTSCGQEKGKIGLFYTSVLYHITPTGNHSLTTKSFDTTSNMKKIEKFKFDNLYKWAECQKSIYNNYTQILKMKDIDKRLKELNKDFE